jgi:hypothetical protein
MCLLITHQANADKFDYDTVEDFYWYNSDGVGVMYAENGELVVKKALPKDPLECFEFIRENAEGRNCAIHLRMRTHGPISPARPRRLPTWQQRRPCC